jgi:urease accessory protein
METTTGQAMRDDHFRTADAGSSLRMAPAKALIQLLTWFSPAFPVGAYSFSHGFEYLVETADVCDAPTLATWITAVLRYGAGRSDAVLLTSAYRACCNEAWDDLTGIAELARALQPTAERRLESVSQGTAFLAAVDAGWPHPLTRRLLADGRGEIALPVAVAVAGAAHRLPLASVLACFLHALTANLVSAGVRLIPLGQTAGLRIVSDLEQVVIEVADEACCTGLDDVGSCTVLCDIASMHHETQYSRLFRS